MSVIVRLLLSLALLCAHAPAHARSTQSSLLFPNNGPSLNLNLLTGRLPPAVAFARADCSPSGACATYFDSTGTLQTAATNVPRFDNNPSSLAPLGLTLEQVSTNQIRNNTSVGAVVGVPGTNLVTNGTFTGTSGTGWSTNLNGGTGSVSFAVTGQATISGDGTHQSALYQSLTTIIGHVYIISATVGTNPVFVPVGNTQGNAALLSTTFAVGSNKASFTATATTTFINFAITSAGVPSTVSNVSVVDGGVIPTNTSLSLGGLAVAVTGVSTESGISYTEYQFSGTSNGTFASIAYETATQIAALTAQTWDESSYLRFTGGSLSGVSANFSVQELTSGGAFIQSDNGGSALPTGAALATQRMSFSLTTSGGATTAFVRPLYVLNFPTSTALNFTLRVGMAQMEQMSSATSVIATAGVAVTRAKDTAYALTNMFPYSNVNGTAVVAYDVGTASIGAPVGFSDGTFGNSLYVAGAGAFGGGATLAITTPATGGTINKVALSYRVGKAVAAVLGGVPSGTGSASTTTNPPYPWIGRLSFGNTPWALDNQINGHVRSVQYWPRGMSIGELQSVTK